MEQQDMTHNSAETTTVTSQKSTYEQLAKLDPSLNVLLRRARNQSGNCANAAWYGPQGLRKRMQQVVGHLRGFGPVELQTSAAYDVAYRTLYAVLPDCNGCGCLSLEELLIL
jgi:hypothetical protein